MMRCLKLRCVWERMSIYLMYTCSTEKNLLRWRSLWRLILSIQITVGRESTEESLLRYFATPQIMWVLPKQWLHTQGERLVKSIVLREYGSEHTLESKPGIYGSKSR